MTDRHTIHHGDCREVMASMDADSVDAIVTDPPYGLSFMGKGWDHGVPGVEFWTEAMRVAKPGAHLLAFGGTRTYHRLACAIEDAGWEVRDCVMWVYGSGFPKSLDVGKAIDKSAGAERGRTLRPAFGGTFSDDDGTTYGTVLDSEPITDLARQWHGWGTALKPAWEPIIVARKPLIGTVAANVTEWGTGAINVDGCRVGTEPPPSVPQPKIRPNGADSGHALGTGEGRNGTMSSAPARWPANFIHDGSDEVVDGMGDASRYFYCPKASKADRNEGCEGLEERMPRDLGMGDNAVGAGRGSRSGPRTNHHPTVKPTALMAYLCRLVTQPDGLILDPFCGSGSTGKAAVSEGFRFVGIEREAEYVEIAERRVSAAVPADLFAEATP